jgi:hypothetical protein
MQRMVENITRMALEEMVLTHAAESKFGYVISEEGFRLLVDDLYEFFETSRALKAAGDRFLRKTTEVPRSR